MGERLAWDAVPSQVRASIEQELGGTVVAIEPQTGGFSRGVAVRLVLDTGRRVFVKGVPWGEPPGTAELYEREADLLGKIPRSVPAPRLLARWDIAGWMVLAIEDVDGWHPDEEPTSSDTAAVFAAFHALPRELDNHGEFESLSTSLEDDARAWRRLAEAGKMATTPPWAEAHLDELIRSSEAVTAAVDGSALIHGDARRDNILVNADGAWLLDWGWGMRGAHWFDALCYALDLKASKPEQEVQPLLDHEIFEGVSPHDIDSLLAALAGQWFEKCLLPAPLGMPALRAFQRKEAETSLMMLADRWETR